LSLIYNVLYFTFGNPIDVTGEFFRFIEISNFFLFGWFETKVQGLKFGFVEIGELIFTHGIGNSVFRVVFRDGFHVSSIDGESVGFFLFIGVLFAICSFEFGEIGLAFKRYIVV